MVEILYGLLWWLFDPILWSVPFVAVCMFAVYRILFFGLYSLFEFGSATLNARKEGVKSYGSLNVLLFGVLWIVALFVFTTLNVNRFLSVYLCFCTIFAAYGISELYARVIWFRQLVGAYSLMSVLKGAMYPVFFVVNHVPVFLFLKVYPVYGLCLHAFLGLQFAHLFLYVIHGYEARIIEKQDHVIRSYYYAGRTLAIGSYIILLVGFII